MKLLIVEDETFIRESVQEFLISEGFLCEATATFSEASFKLDLYEYDLILVDITLPDGNGLNLVKQAKLSHPKTGIIVISARNSLDDKISGLDLGADDYLTKPFHLSELNSRIKALLRRRWFQGSEEINLGSMRINPEKRQLIINNQIVELTRKEFDLILFLVTNPNRVLTKENIAEHLLGDNSDLMENFDFIYTHMNNLRRKLANQGVKDPVKTIYGVGYKFDTHETA
ncbi:MAG: response regulator transcription factor [Bacteroidia bacterium]|nr:response regulator transcription factor [Bacteroidia bacterium]